MGIQHVLPEHICNIAETNQRELMKWLQLDINEN